MKLKLLLLFLLGSVGFCHAAFDPARDPFVLGFYSADPMSDKTMELIKSTGAEYIHSYNAWKQTPVTRQLDLAQKHDLKVIYDLGSHARLGKEKLRKANWQEDMLATVKAVKDHPALAIWYLWDEPSTAMLRTLRELRKLVKTQSSVPSAIVIHERSNYWDSRGHSDIWMVDNYPVRGEVYPDAPLKWHSRMMRNAAASYNYKGTPFIAVMQAMDFSCFKSNIKVKENLQRLRFPNTEEMRFMVYSDFCYGVRGMLFYSFYHCHIDRPEGKKFFEEVLRPMMLEIKEFTTMLPEVWNVTVRNSKKIDLANKVSFAYFKRPEKSFIILVNDTNEKRDLKVDLTEYDNMPADGKLVPWKFTRQAGTLQNRILKVSNANPWEVFVWEVK